MSFSTVAILGMGMMGSSVARAVRACLPGVTLHALDSDPETLRIAQEMGLADLCTTNPAQAVHDADLVILAAPIGALASLAEAIAPHLKPGAVVTDIASVKRLLFAKVAPLLPEGVALVPGHPIAGSEKSGVSSGTAMLFAGKRVILTPENPENAAVSRVAQFWKSLCVEVHYMPAELHDEIYACVSHLPQYISYLINDLFVDLKVEGEMEGGGRFFRLTHSPLAIWEEIFVANSDNINKCLDRYLQALHQISVELREGAGAAVVVQPDMALLCTELFPRIAASCLVHAAHVTERALHVPIRAYAGTGFIDFTAPAREPPDTHLANISDHAAAMVTLLDHFTMLLSRRRYIT